MGKSNSTQAQSGKKKLWKVLMALVAALILAMVLVSILFFPVFRIYGHGMAPTLETGDLVLAQRSGDFDPGDIVAFYYNDKILVKRVLAGPGDYVDIDDNGNFFVNGTIVEEPYLSEKAVGDTDIYYPYQVPAGRWFLVGDDRSTSLDSRNSRIGDVASEQIIGKLLFRFWPFTHLGMVRD